MVGIINRTPAIPPDRINTIRQVSECLTIQEDRALRLFAGRQQHWDRLGAKWRLAFGWILQHSPQPGDSRRPDPAYAVRTRRARRAHGLMEQAADQVVFRSTAVKGLSAHVDAADSADKWYRSLCSPP